MPKPLRKLLHQVIIFTVVDLLLISCLSVSGFRYQLLTLATAS